MRLFEAIVDANHRALAGDATAGLHPADFADSLPVAALTCIDARLNPLFPEVLGLPKEQFIWLRNAGNIVTGPLSSTMRSLALACAVKGGKEIAIIGHNDCLVCKTSTAQLTDAFAALGVDRAGLPPNLTEFFGLFASERQNVLKAVEFVRHSPIIGSKVPVHGLIVDIQSGKLEWVSNGYQTMGAAESFKAEGAKLMDETSDVLKSLPGFVIGEMKFPETKIGELATDARNWLSQEIGNLSSQPPAPSPVPGASNQPPPAPPIVRVAPPVAKRVPVPPPVRPAYTYPKNKKF
ncbi:MAG TPA: carbonic anhydrase [Verrucomicrobiae bacterium]|nr:carbonic anhydrase [Verrucomicrobiae bacterium]